MKNCFTEPAAFLTTCVKISKEHVTFLGMTELCVSECVRMRVCVVVIHMSVNLLKHNSLTTNTIFVVVHTVDLCILAVK